jgi:hypothetical protein
MLIKHKKTLKSTGAPLCASSFGDEMYMIDSSYVFYRIDKKSFTVSEAKRINAKNQPHHNIYRGFSASGHHMAITLAGKNAVFLLDVKEGLKNVGTSKWHLSQVESSLICNKGRFFLSGGQDGKVYIYDMEGVNLIGSLPQRPDYIGAINVGHAKNIVATSCFDRSITLHDMDKNVEIDRFKTTEVAQSLLFFDDDNFLFAACRDGKGIVYDIKLKTVRSTNTFFTEWPIAMTYSKDHRHALVGTRDGYIHAIDLRHNYERFKIRVREIGISNLFLDDSHLFVSYVDGVTEIFDVNEGEEKIKMYILQQNYDKAREELDLNTMLFLHPVIDLFDRAWDDALEAVKKALLNDDLMLASKIASPFLFDVGKKEQFHILMADLEHVSEFKEAFDRKDLAKAYELAEKEPLLKKYPIFDQMEAGWAKTITAIKTLLQSDPDGNLNKCNVLLKPYMTIPDKRKTAQDIINNAHVYIEAENAVAAKDFKEYYRLVKMRPFIKETPMFKKLEALSLRVLERINDLLKDEEYAEVVKLAKSSLQLAPIEAQLKAVMVEVANRLKFIAASKAKDLRTVYELLQQYDSFSYLKEFDLIDEAFKKQVSDAMEHAFSGNSMEVYARLNFYFQVPYRMDKAAQVMKISYLNEMEQQRDSDSVDWKATFKKYIDLFSKDAELKRIAMLIDQSAVLETMESNHGGEQGYRRSEIPSNIVVERD